MTMGNTNGKITPPSAMAVIRKNSVATVTKSRFIIPFHKFFASGSGVPSAQPPRNWMTNK